MVLFEVLCSETAKSLTSIKSIGELVCYFTLTDSFTCLNYGCDTISMSLEVLVHAIDVIIESTKITIKFIINFLVSQLFTKMFGVFKTTVLGLIHETVKTVEVIQKFKEPRENARLFSVVLKNFQLYCYEAIIKQMKNFVF